MRTFAHNTMIAFLRNKSAVAVVAALFSITTIIFYDSLWYGFVYSDLPVIKHFLYGQLVSFWHIFSSQPRWISFLLNKVLFVIGGDNPFVYRLACLVLHLLNGLLIFAIISIAAKQSATLILSSSKDAPAGVEKRGNLFLQRHGLAVASLTMLLLLLHPVQTQTVLFIPQMQLEGFVLLFALLSIIAVQLAAQAKTTRGTHWSFLLMFVASVGATGAKEIAVVIPLLVLLFDWFFVSMGSVSDLLKRWYLYAVSGGIMGAAFFWYGTLKPGFIIRLAHAAVQNDCGNVLTASPQMPITLQPYALSQFKVIVHYLKIFIWPVNLCYDYDMMLSYHWDKLDVLLPAAICVSLLIVAVWAYRRQQGNLLSFGIAWFLLAIVPRVSIFPAAELVCDYKTYLASFGVMIALSYLIILLGRVVFRAWPMLIALGPSTVKVCAVALLSYCLTNATAKRQLVWQDEFSFWKDVVTKVPKPRAINNFAVALWHMGNIDEAVSYFEQAIAKDHWYAEPHANLGTIYQLKGDREKALHHYVRAIAIGDGHTQLFNNLGQLHASRGADYAAELCFLRAIELPSATPNPYINIGRLYEKQGRKSEALALYKQAFERRIINPELLYACGVLAYDMKELKVAIKAFKQLDKNYEQTAFLLGCCYYDEQRFAKAVGLLEVATKKDPLNIKYIYHYAQALMQAERFTEAAAMYTLCMTHEQAYESASLHKIYCLYRADEKERAQHELQALLQHGAHPQVLAEALQLKQKYVA